MKNSSTSRTLETLDVGENVQVLERRDNWYRIRSGDVEGWMEESTVVTNDTKNRIQQLASAAQTLEPQNTAARALYGRYGFKDCYAYWYRLPAEQAAA